jgi:TctA family transporter
LGVVPIVNVFARLILRDSIALLNFTFQLLTLAIYGCQRGAAKAAPSSLKRMRSSLRVLLPALTGLLLATLLAALARLLLLLLARLRLT